MQDYSSDVKKSVRKSKDVKNEVNLDLNLLKWDESDDSDND